MVVKETKHKKLNLVSLIEQQGSRSHLVKFSILQADTQLWKKSGKLVNSS